MTKTEWLKKNWFKLVMTLILLLFVGSYVYFKINPDTTLSSKDTSTQASSSVQDQLLSLKKELSKYQSQLSLQSDQIKATEQTVSQNSSKATLSPTDIVKEWKPFMAIVGCGDGAGNMQFGSGTLLFKNDSKSIYGIITNAHVVEDDNGNIMPRCGVVFSEFKKVYSVTPSEIIDLRAGDTSSDLDVAAIMLPEDPTLDYFMKPLPTVCNYQGSQGENIVILGYPGVANQELTETSGLISGYDGIYYTTSADIGHGNSGGAAISLSHDCYLGIPTGVVSDDVESLGRVLSWLQVSKYLNN